jgi:hypothetical protein
MRRVQLLLDTIASSQKEMDYVISPEKILSRTSRIRVRTRVRWAPWREWLTAGARTGIGGAQLALDLVASMPASMIDADVLNALLRCATLPCHIQTGDRAVLGCGGGLMRTCAAASCSASHLPGILRTSRHQANEEHVL